MTNLFQTLRLPLCFLIIGLLMACSNPEETTTTPEEPDTTIPNENDMNTDNQAAITAVTFTGSANNYTFNVTIKSPDTGCDQYADWWEVFNADGELIYRRILGHSHVDEQPFTRSGGPVNVGSDDFIYIRAHMNNLGYGTAVFGGKIGEGLVADTLDVDFAGELETTDPLPTSCAF